MSVSRQHRRHRQPNSLLRSARGRLAPSLTNARLAWPHAIKDGLQDVVFKSERSGPVLAASACACANGHCQHGPSTESP